MNTLRFFLPLPVVLGGMLTWAWVSAVVIVGGQNASAPTLSVLSREGRRSLSILSMNDQDFVFLDELSAVFQTTTREDTLGALTVAYKGKTILLTPDQPLASIAGRLIPLPAGPIRSARRWAVPVDFIGRALSLVYDLRLDLRKSSRLVVVGDLRVPRTTVRVEGNDPARVTLETTPHASSSIFLENGSLIVKFDADALDLTLPSASPSVLVRAVRIVDPASVVVDLGPRFMAFRAASETTGNMGRVTIDVLSTQPETQPSAPAPPPGRDNPEALPLTSTASSAHSIAIDPGHGGDDEGAKGVGGTKEKDLTLAVARRVRGLFETRLGLRVLLTRDEDRSVSLDDRTATANNSKADLLISLHANASLSTATTGASILYAAFDREGAGASPIAARLPVLGGGMRELDLLPWEEAQRRHVDQSAALAQALAAELRDHVPINVHAIERAPLSVLEPANMPAVLIEMGYLTNAGQEAAMTSMEFQTRVAQAIFDAAFKFRNASLVEGGR